MNRRPIVYSARYYSSPQQSDKPSYWHLYRINPDGTERTQLTSAYADDQSPQWSPGGSYISFLRRRRAYRNTAGPSTLCLWDSDGDVRAVYSASAYLEHRWLGSNTLLVRESPYHPDQPQRYFKIDVRTGRHDISFGLAQSSANGSVVDARDDFAAFDFRIEVRVQF